MTWQDMATGAIAAQILGEEPTTFLLDLRPSFHKTEPKLTLLPGQEPVAGRVICSSRELLTIIL